MENYYKTIELNHDLKSQKLDLKAVTRHTLNHYLTGTVVFLLNIVIISLTFRTGIV